MGSSPTDATNLCELHVPLSKALYSNCSVVRRSRKAVGPVYMYLNINTSMHVKERHRLFEKSRGSSRYCWLYFKNTFIYSRTRGKVQLVCTQCVNTQAYEFSTNNRGRRRRRCSLHGHHFIQSCVEPATSRLWIGTLPIIKEAQSDCCNFFSNLWRFWYHKKAHTLIFFSHNPWQISQLKSVLLGRN